MLHPIRLIRLSLVFLLGLLFVWACQATSKASTINTDVTFTVNSDAGYAAIMLRNQNKETFVVYTTPQTYTVEIGRYTYTVSPITPGFVVTNVQCDTEFTYTGDILVLTLHSDVRTACIFYVTSNTIAPQSKLYLPFVANTTNAATLALNVESAFDTYSIVTDLATSQQYTVTLHRTEFTVTSGTHTYHVASDIPVNGVYCGDVMESILVTNQFTVTVPKNRTVGCTLELTSN